MSQKLMITTENFTKQEYEHLGNFLIKELKSHEFIVEEGSLKHELLRGRAEAPQELFDRAIDLLRLVDVQMELFSKLVFNKYHRYESECENWRQKQEETSLEIFDKLLHAHASVPGTNYCPQEIAASLNLEEYPCGTNTKELRITVATLLRGEKALCEQGKLPQQESNDIQLTELPLNIEFSKSLKEFLDKTQQESQKIRIELIKMQQRHSEILELRGLLRQLPQSIEAKIPIETLLTPITTTISHLQKKIDDLMSKSETDEHGSEILEINNSVQELMEAKGHKKEEFQSITRRQRKIIDKQKTQQVNIENIGRNISKQNKMITLFLFLIVIFNALSICLLRFIQ